MPRIRWPWNRWDDSDWLMAIIAVVCIAVAASVIYTVLGGD